MSTEYELPINEDNPTSISVGSSGIIYAGINRNSKAVKTNKNDHLRVFQLTSNAPKEQQTAGTVSANKEASNVNTQTAEKDESIQPTSTSTFFSSGSIDEYQKCTVFNSVTNTLAICNSLHGTKGTICVLSASPDEPQTPPVLRYRSQTNNGEEVNDLDISSDGQLIVYITDSALVILPAFTHDNSSAKQSEKPSVVSTVAPVCITNIPSNICPNESTFAKVKFLSKDTLLVAINHPKRTGVTFAILNHVLSKPVDKSQSSEQSEKQTSCSVSKYQKVIHKSSITSLDTFVANVKEQTTPSTGYAAFATADLSIGVVSLPFLDPVFLERNAHPFAITKVALSAGTGSILASVSVANTIAVHKLQDPVTQALSTQQAKKRKVTIVYTLLSAVLLVVTAVLLQAILQYKILGDLMQKANNVKEMQGNGSKTEFSEVSHQTNQEAYITLTTHEDELPNAEQTANPEDVEKVQDGWSQPEEPDEVEDAPNPEPIPEPEDVLEDDQTSQDSGSENNEAVIESEDVPEPEPIPAPEDFVEKEESRVPQQNKDEL